MLQKMGKNIQTTSKKKAGVGIKMAVYFTVRNINLTAHTACNLSGRIFFMQNDSDMKLKYFDYEHCYCANSETQIFRIQIASICYLFFICLVFLNFFFKKNKISRSKTPSPSLFCMFNYLLHLKHIFSS